MSSGKQNVRGKEYTVLYFMGYKEAVPHTVHDPVMYHDIRGQSFKVRDPALQLSHEQQIRRARALTRLQAKARAGKVTKTKLQEARKSTGSKGLSIIPFILPYVDYNNLFVVPVAHVLLYGLVASFINYILRDGNQGPDFPVLNSATRKTIQQRGSGIGVTSEFGRRYKDVIKYKGSYRMEDWLHFTTTFSNFLFFDGTLPDPLEKMWSLLQIIVHHYCHGLPFSQGDAEVAGNALLEYAKLVEEHFEAKMCTYNLHIAVCRLPEQERQRGSAAMSMEFVVERAMQIFKQLSGRRVSRDPEKIFVGDYLLEQALLQVMSNPKYNEKEEIPKYNTMCGDVGMRVLSGTCYDKRDTHADPVLLLGKGQPLSNDQVEHVKKAILTYAPSVGMEGAWTAATIDKVLRKPSSRRTRCVDQHALAFCRMEVNGDIFISQLYSRCDRVNYLIQIGYEEGTASKPVMNHYVGLLHFIVRVPYSGDFQPPVVNDAQAPTALKLAIVSFYKRLDVRGREVTSDDSTRPMLQVINFSQPIPDESFYPVDPLSITSKLCTGNIGKEEVFCMPYNTFTVRQ